jgi:hypothetical protein
VQNEAGKQFRISAVILLYWFSGNWKFAFGPLAHDGFDSSTITL